MAVAPSWFVFVHSGRFLEPVRPRTVIVNNTTIINKTVNITKIRTENKTIANLGTRKVVVNDGPRVDLVEKATSRKVRAAAVTEVARQTKMPAALKPKATSRPSPSKQRRETSTEDRPNTELRRQRPTVPMLAPREEPKAEPRREPPPGDVRDRPEPGKIKPPPAKTPDEAPPPKKELPKKHHEGDEEQTDEGPPGHGKGKD